MNLAQKFKSTVFFSILLPILGIIEATWSSEKCKEECSNVSGANWRNFTSKPREVGPSNNFFSSDRFSLTSLTLNGIGSEKIPEVWVDSTPTLFPFLKVN